MKTIHILIETIIHGIKVKIMNRVPKLRFPEFIGKWEEKKLSEVTTLITKGTTPKKFDEDNLSGIRYIKIESLNGNIIDNQKCLFIDEKTHNNELKRSILQENDILFAIAGSLGKNAIVKNQNLPANTNQALSIIRLNGTINYNFVLYTLNSSLMEKYIRENIAVGAQPNLNLEQINKFSFYLPSFSEQEKIATFLSSVDTKIEKLERKKELWAKYKKVVMQKIFSQKIRFEDDNGNEYHEWEEKTLGEIGEIITGKTPNTKDKNLWNGTIQFVTPTDILNNKYQNSTLRTVKENKKNKLLPKGAIFYTCIASIGKIALSVNPCITNQQINSLIVENDNNEFIYYGLLYITPQIKATQANTTLPIINKTEFSKFLLNIPCLEEQEKIANFLSLIDLKIETIEKELNKMKKFKSGLLQQMFV